MRVAIHTPDDTGFPNLALMKISAWHKNNGDTIEWFDGFTSRCIGYDKVYSSKIFTFSDEDKYLPYDAILGGTGYGLMDTLSVEVDSIFPDYSIYPNVDSAIGFLTRGCPNKCSWCIVPKKEGEIKPYLSWKAVKRKDSRNIVFMDNNVLASDWGLSNIEDMGGRDLRVDFNQGLDARLITKSVAHLLGNLFWLKPIRMACDHKSQMPYIEQAVKYLREEHATPKNYFCYVLVKDIDDAYERVMFLKGLGVDPFAQPYRDFENNIEPTKEQKDFSRWVNHKAIFKSVAWEDYKAWRC